MRIIKNIRLTGLLSIVFIATLLGTGCQTWQAYPGSVIKGDDAVLQVSRSGVIYVTTVDGMRYPQDPQSEFQGPIRLLPGRHEVTFILEGPIPGPWTISHTQGGSAITMKIFVEPGKTYEPHATVSGNKWFLQITEKK